MQLILVAVIAQLYVVTANPAPEPAPAPLPAPNPAPAPIPSPAPFLPFFNPFSLFFGGSSSALDSHGKDKDKDKKRDCNRKTFGKKKKKKRKQKKEPCDCYGVPSSGYGAPSTGYGAPHDSYGTPHAAPVSVSVAPVQHTGQERAARHHGITHSSQHTRTFTHNSVNTHDGEHTHNSKHTYKSEHNPTFTHISEHIPTFTHFAKNTDTGEHIRKQSKTSKANSLDRHKLQSMAPKPQTNTHNLFSDKYILMYFTPPPIFQPSNKDNVVKPSQKDSSKISKSFFSQSHINQSNFGNNLHCYILQPNIAIKNQKILKTSLEKTDPTKPSCSGEITICILCFVPCKTAHS